MAEGPMLGGFMLEEMQDAVDGLALHSNGFDRYIRTEMELGERVAWALDDEAVWGAEAVLYDLFELSQKRR